MLNMKKVIRGIDSHGSGAWLATRGSRQHQGEDIECCAYDAILSDVDGIVTKIGYPYNPNDRLKGHLRYVEVTDSKRSRVRYFYISPNVSIRQKIKKGDVLGVSSNLKNIWDGMTQHYHLEVIAYIKPTDYLESVA